MFVDVDSLITAKLRAEFEREQAQHEPSGLLSAGYLKRPLLEQCLKVVGVPPKPVEDYVLRLFKRGKQVEELVTNALEPESVQEEFVWRDVAGIIDCVKDGYPVEVKSVKSTQLKYLEKSGPQWGDVLQAVLYGLYKGSEMVYLVYASGNDFQSYTFEVEVAKHREEVVGIRDEVYGQLRAHTLPAFTGREEWHNKPTYAERYTNYPEWLSLTPALAMQKLERQFPDSFNKLKMWEYGE